VNEQEAWLDLMASADTIDVYYYSARRGHKNPLRLLADSINITNSLWGQWTWSFTFSPAGSSLPRTDFYATNR
jgi:hypothetical protein